MSVVARIKFVRISSRKVRLVTRTLPGKDVTVAEHELEFMQKGASIPILDLLKSAIANAENNFDMVKDNLYVKEVQVGEGQTYKRWQPASRGMANEIKKRTSNVSLVLEEREKGKRKTAKEKKADAKKSSPKVTKVKTKKDINKLVESEGKSEDKAEKTGYFQKDKQGDSQGQSNKGLKGIVNKMFRRKSSED